MKSKEEIETICSNIIDSESVNEKFKQAVYEGAILGYTQCQQDMNDVIKQAIEYGYQLRCNNKPINSGIDWVKEFNSLNKQDNE